MKDIYTVLLALPLILHNFEITCAPVEDDSLILVHVIFRHGNRTPSLEEMYPKDPYRNEKYFPFGLGQLTNVGKKREFMIGKALRNRYNKFLGPYYYPEIVEARSTDYNRTKMSLELALAGLFPPRGEEVWNYWLNWQPVPYNYVPQANDNVLLGTLCPNFVKKTKEYLQSGREQTELSKYREVLDYISENAGINVTSFLDVYSLYFGLTTEAEWGFELPEWTQKVYPEPITQLAINEYYTQTATTELMQMSAGYFLQKVIQDSYSKINNTNSDRKIYMYAAHENNIADLLILLGVFEPPHIPNYGAYVLLELHSVNNKYGIRIFYENYQETRPQLLKVPNCDSFCKIDQFASLYEEYMPDPDLCYSV
ncbi:venom acid phosphatase Acph-1 [Tribolium castaneum]|uniref:venom acid phosphatase Acph-1 n=1 Tax=Tribolium castaneum TaxID=7070 RepID=UPI0030FEA30A